MAKREPRLERSTVVSKEWCVIGCDYSCALHFNDYDEALAEFERQVEIYRAPPRKRLLGWVFPESGAVALHREGHRPEADFGAWVRAPWLDEKDE